MSIQINTSFPIIFKIQTFDNNPVDVQIIYFDLHVFTSLDLRPTVSDKKRSDRDNTFAQMVDRLLRYAANLVTDLVIARHKDDIWAGSSFMDINKGYLVILSR